MPQTRALTTSLAVAFAHTWGATTWLMNRLHHVYQACTGLFAVTAVLVAMGIRWGWQAQPRSDAPVAGHLPLVARWGLIATLFGITAYLYLWPRKL